MKMYRILSIFLAVAILLGMVACQPQPPAPVQEKPAESEKPVVTEKPAESVQPTATEKPSEVQAPADPFGKFDPPIKLTIGRSQGSGHKFIKGEDWENNMWQKKFLDDLGIETDHTFVIDSTEYENKVNMAIASGEIPDTMFVNFKQLAMLIEDDMIVDMTSIFDEYATDLSKSLYGPGIFDLAKVNGKLWGIPLSGSTFDGTKVIWIRNDWLKKTGLNAPTTYEELKAIATAFVNDDPDGNGAKDTYAFSVQKDPFGSSSSSPGWHELTGLAAAFHAYPNIWIKGTDGKLVYGSTTPEMKATLKEAADLFAQGYIDPEFAVKDDTKATEFLGNNKVGIVFGNVWAPFSGMGDHMAKNPEADWKAYALVSNDNERAKPLANVPLGTFAVVRKGYEHPEAIVKMFNLVNRVYWGPVTPEQEDFVGTEYSSKYADEGAMPFLYSYPYMEEPTINLISYEEITQAVEADSLDVIDRVVVMNKSMTELGWSWLKDGDISNWWMEVIFIGPESGQAIHMKNYTDNNVMMNQFYGPPTPTMLERMSTLDQLQQETFIRIITGDLPIDEFDKFVDQWKELGGQQITDEVNEWYAKK